jgi:hypothetical protein
MNEVNATGERNYEWYQVHAWSNVLQGDLLFGCPVLVPPANLTPSLSNAKEGDNLRGNLLIQRADLIVLSQSCDLQNDKIDQVLLCAHFPASSYSNSERKSIRREQRPSNHMIERCLIIGHEFERRVIDFRTIYTLPKDFVTAFALKAHSRARLLPPYREHLSQAFARYFMRVGLPRPLEDD